MGQNSYNVTGKKQAAETASANIGDKKEVFKQDPKMLEVFGVADSNNNGKLDTQSEVSLFNQKAQQAKQAPENEAPFLLRKPDNKLKDLTSFNMNFDNGAEVFPKNFVEKSNQQKQSQQKEAQVKAETQTPQQIKQQAAVLAKQLYKIADDHSGAVSRSDFQTNLNKISANNVVDVIKSYDEVSSDESMLEMICDEKGNSDATRKAAVSTIYNKLLAKGKAVGLNEQHLENFKKSFNNEMNVQFDSMYVDTEKMDKLLYGLVQSIDNAQTVSSEERAKIKAQPPKAQQEDAIKFLNNKTKMAQTSLENQQNYDGWIGKMVDGMSVVWGSENRADIVKEDISKYNAQIKSLDIAKNQGDTQFKAQFKKLYGVEFDPIQMAAYKKQEGKYINSASNYGVETQFNSKMKNLLSDGKLREESTYISQPHGPSQVVVMATKEQVYNREVANFADFLGQGNKEAGMKYINEALAKVGINPQKATKEQMFNAITGFAKNYSKSLHQNTMKATGGKPFDAVQKEFDNSYTAAFGTKNNIAERVNKYNVSQQTGSAVAKGVIVTVGATVIGTLTGGAGLVPAMTAAMGTTAFSAGVGLSDRATSKNGLSTEEASKILKDATIDGTTMILSGGLGHLAKSANLGSAATYALRTAGDTFVDMGAEYLQTEDVTLINTLISAVASFGGQVTENIIEARREAKALSTGDINPQALAEYNAHSLADQTSAHTINYDPRTGGNRPVQSAQYMERQRQIDGFEPLNPTTDKNTIRFEDATRKQITADQLSSLGAKDVITLDDLKALGLNLETTIEAKDFQKAKQYLEYDIMKPTVDLAEIEQRISTIGNASQRAELRSIVDARRKSLATDFNVEANSKVIETTTGDATNKWWKDFGYSEPPYKPGNSEVKIIELTKETKFVRVFDDQTSFMGGGWIMKYDDIKGLTPAQIKDKFALPAMPVAVAEATFPTGTKIRTGEVNPLPQWGKGGGTQYDLMGQRVGKFSEPRLLK